MGIPDLAVGFRNPVFQPAAATHVTGTTVTDEIVSLEHCTEGLDRDCSFLRILGLQSFVKDEKNRLRVGFGDAEIELEETPELHIAGVANALFRFRDGKAPKEPCGSIKSGFSEHELFERPHKMATTINEP